jgi:hypothetical protein
MLKALPVMKRSKALPLRTAQAMARGMPIVKAPIWASSISSSETGSRSATACSTVCPVRNDLPKSPCSTLPSQDT